MQTTRHAPNELGNYRLVAQIARGGMGIVYLALVQGQAGFEKLVVVKELIPELARDELFLRMFLEEARLAARLNHPNIVQSNEVGRQGQRCFMAMDYLDGQTLNRIVRRFSGAARAFPLALHLRALRDVLRALEYAHTLRDFDGTPLGIVHRDVSPHNVFITYDGQVKLVDFGIAKTADSSIQTKTGVLKGKVAYMAPDQVQGERVDARADVFSVGVMLWEALVGARLWEGKGELQIFHHLANEDIPSPRSVKPEIPEELDRICRRALERDRAARYPSAGELEADLERFVAQSGLDATPRELGATVAAAFAADRQETSAQIDVLLAGVREGRASSSIPTLAIGEAISTPVDEELISTQLMAPPAVSGDRLRAASAPRVPVATVPVAEEPAPRAAPPSPLPPAPPPRRSRPIARWVVAAALVVTAGTATAMWRRSLHPPIAALTASAPAAPIAPPPVAPPMDPPAPSTTPSAITSAAPITPTQAPAPAASVALSVRILPANAHLTIDDRPVRGPAFVGHYAPGTTVHVRASAPGYITKTQAVSASADTALTLTLAHAPEPPRAAPRPAAASRNASPTVAAAAPAPASPMATTSPFGGDVSPSGGRAPRRAIDTTNPYSGR